MNRTIEPSLFGFRLFMFGFRAQVANHKATDPKRILLLKFKGVKSKIYQDTVSFRGWP